MIDCEQCAALRAEVERLSTFAKRAAMDVLLCKDGNILAHEENEKLRAALREYVCNCPKNTCEYFPCGEFARAALEGK